MMNASTDVSCYGNKILFGYVIMDEDNKYVVSEKCYYSERIEEGIAEDIAVALLLKDVVESGYEDEIKIKCDSLSTVQRIKGLNKGSIYKRYKKIFSYINEALSYGGSSIAYVPREENTFAHNACGKLRQDVLIKGNKTKLKYKDVKISDFCIYNLPNRINPKCRKVRTYKRIGDINSSINKQDRRHLVHEYRKLVDPEKMKNLEHLFVWGSIQKCSNTHEGRKRFVRKFVYNQHTSDEIRKKVAN